MQVAQGREIWRGMEEPYVQEWVGENERTDERTNQQICESNVISKSTPKNRKKVYQKDMYRIRPLVEHYASHISISAKLLGPIASTLL